MHPQTMPINPLPDTAPEVIEDRDCLQHLHDRITDALEGFRVMAAEAEPAFRPVVERFVALHADHTARVADMLVSRGAGGDLDGTLMGTVNKAVVSVRALVTTIDAGVLDSIRSGEEHVLSAFDRAIGGVVRPDDGAVLTTMQDELVALLDDTRDLG
ncbi:MAG: DUF2383 domain-containing protein [Gemmobacter sp.]